MKTLRNALLDWIPIAVALTLICGVFYVTVQQSYRSGANDPQIQMAEDTARRLETEPASSVIPVESVELSESLAPFVMVIDVNGNVTATNARLHGQIPQFVTGPLRVARQKGENRITWQPDAGVRSAVVIVPVAGGDKDFVLAGRSLREVEKRVDDLSWLVGVGLVGSLVGSLVAAVVAELLKR